MVGSDFIESFNHAFLVYPYLSYLVFDSSKIWKQAVPSWEIITSFYAVSLKYFIVVVNPESFVSYMSYSRVFVSPVSRTSYPLIPDLSMNFPYHIRHFSFSPEKGIIGMLFSPIL